MVTAHSPAWSQFEEPECRGLASGRWLKAAQAYRKMRRQHPLDLRQEAQLERSIPRSSQQQAGPRGPVVSMRSACQVPSCLALEDAGVEASQDPSPLIFRQKLGLLSQLLLGLATAWRSWKVPLRSALPLCAVGRKDHCDHSLLEQDWEGCSIRGLCLEASKSRCSSTGVGMGEG